MKFLLVGLGNPGAEYARTRHNIGFMALDALAGASEATFAPDRLGDVARCKHKGRQLVLVKPSTFMNLSGKSVRYWLDAEKIGADRLLVVTDDINLLLARSGSGPRAVTEGTMASRTSKLYWAPTHTPDCGLGWALTSVLAAR